MFVLFKRYFIYTSLFFTVFGVHASQVSEGCQGMFSDHKDFREKVSEITLLQRDQESQILKEVADAKNIINTFTTVHFLSEPQLNTPLMKRFVSLYVYRSTVRRWAHELQIFYDLKYDLTASQKGLKELELSLKEEASRFSLMPFFQAYNKDSSFRKLVNQLQSFVLHIPQIRKDQEFYNFLKNFGENTIFALIGQHRREIEVFKKKTDQETFVKEFIALQKIKKKELFWVRFFHMYTQSPRFRDFVKSIQLYKILSQNKLLDKYFSKEDIDKLTISILVGIYSEVWWSDFLEEYNRTPSFRDIVSELQKFVFDYTIK